MLGYKDELFDKWKYVYDVSLSEHLKYFKEAAKKLDVPGEQVRRHDASKRSPEEYAAYCVEFGGGPTDTDEFKKAWLHHLHNNKHHWQYWIIPGGLNDEDGIIEMPPEFIREMIADWMGSSMAYTGSYDMASWLEKNFGNVYLHPYSRVTCMGLLSSLGYDMRKFY